MLSRKNARRSRVIKKKRNILRNNVKKVNKFRVASGFFPSLERKAELLLKSLKMNKKKKAVIKRPVKK